jgi:opacity protein-like surface antigen
MLNVTKMTVMRRTIASVAVALFIGAVPLAAQDKPLDVNIGGGYTFASGEVRKHLGDGYNVNFGVTINLTETLGIQAEYGFNGLGQKNIQIPVSGAPGGSGTPTNFYADMNMQYGDFNLVFKPKTQKTSPYLVAGAGIYNRPIKVTTPGMGYVPGYCDPWWYVCYPGGWVPVENVVGERSSTDFGVDFGGGLNFGLAEGLKLYVEARYHYIWGPQVKTSANGADTRKANGQFVPIAIGLRF